MNTRIRSSVWVAIGIAVLGAASGVQARNLGERIGEAVREKQGEDSGKQAPAPKPQSQPQPQRQSTPWRRGTERVQNEPPRAAPAPRAAESPRFAGSQSDSRQGDDNKLRDRIRRSYETQNGNGGQAGRPPRGDDRGGHSRDYRPPRVVRSLPPGYHHYNWNGRPYYHYRGGWYQPYGSSFISIGVPYGLFVSTLPGYHTSFWYGGSRYFFADDTYYLWEPARRGYVVSRSPYGDDRDDGEDYAEEPADEDLFIYPARGQSEQQQADDRYECHRWAVSESRYDPIDDEYDADRRDDYKRAITACLTGRGYSVK